MKVLFIGDIIGRPGRRLVLERLPEYLREEGIGLCIANGENGSGGFGLTGECAKDLFAAGVDVLTSGNHIWDRRDAVPYLEGEPRLLRPLNYPPGVPGRGEAVVESREGVPVGVLNLQGRVFMASIDCPFRAADAAIGPLGERARVVFVDFHAEATAEKIAMGWYLDGRATAVVGTHTHVQTADERVLDGGTAYITDTGMTGSVAGVIGMKKQQALQRFLTQLPKRFEPESKDVRMMGVVVEVDENTGRALSIRRISETSRNGGD